MEYVASSVWNKRRRYDFDGALLARASSQRAHAARWAELRLYALPPNAHANYVFSRVGFSRVYHQDQCPEVRHRLPFGHEMSTTIEPDALAEKIPCPVCAPARPAALPGGGADFLTTHRFEVTKHFAAVCSDAAALIEVLSERRRTHGQALAPEQPPVLPWLSEQLISAAAVVDPALASAYAVNLTPASGR
jgi:hypothetical protein